MVKQISVEEALKQDVVFLDTRTPKEFAEDSLPKAINTPFFSNEERAFIGTIYKQISREEAIDKGLALFMKHLPNIIQEANKHKNQELVIYCWRGGLRSEIVTAILGQLGFKVKQLSGGHKAYRKYVLKRLSTYDFKPEIIVVWGLTATGKTQLLSHFSNFLDLEDLAQHRGSLYGALGLIPNSQKKFENLFLQRLDQLQSERFILVECESKKIGNVQIPNFFFQKMKEGRNILVTRKMELRAKLTAELYFADIPQTKAITAGLKRVISNKKKREMLQFLDQEKLVEAAQILLQFYYDPLYEHSLKKKEFLFMVNNDNLDHAEKELRQKLTFLYP